MDEADSWRRLVRNFRRHRGWTQATLGEYLGVTQETISRWESGRSIPELAVQRRLRDRLVDGQADLRLLRSVEKSLLARTVMLARRQIVGGPSRTLVVSDGAALEQPLGRRVWFTERTRLEVDLTDEVDALLASNGPFHQHNVVQVCMVGRYLIKRAGSHEYGYAVHQFTPLALTDGTDIYLYERNRVDEETFRRADKRPRFLMVDELIS